MIKKVVDIKDLGLFTQCNWNCSEEFDKYNIIFGFNGSGKTTLSNLLNLVTSNDIYPADKKKLLYDEIKSSDSAELKILHSNGETLSYCSNGSTQNKNVYVFNSNFISNYVYDGQKGNLKKFNVANTELTDPKITDIDSNIESLEKRKQENQNKKDEIFNRFKTIKSKYSSEFSTLLPGKQLKVPNVPDSTQLPIFSQEELISKLQEKRKEYNLSKKSEELRTDINSISSLNLEPLYIDFGSFNRILTYDIKQQVTSSIKYRINRYEQLTDQDNVPLIESWFNLGQKLLEKNKANNEFTCPLCNSQIHIDALLLEYGEYFDNKLEELTTGIDSLLHISTLIEQQFHQNTQAINSIYKFHEKYKSIITNSLPEEVETSQITTAIQHIQKLLNGKLKDKGNNEVIQDNIVAIFNGYNAILKEISDIHINVLKELSEKTLNPEKITEQIRKISTDLIFVETNGGDKNYVNKYHTCQTRIAEIESTINDLKNDKIELLKDLKLESKKVGEYLSRLGITHFTIDLNEEAEEENIHIKYKANPTTKKRLRNTLSEGEKTSLALAYFLSKISIEVKIKSNTIIVIDDPISSLDDNRLYQTAYLLKEEFKECKQLFILSHNLLFLKYLWPLIGKNNNRKGYFIHNNRINDLPASLRNFQTPYFYLLESLMDFVENPEERNYPEARKFIPNYIRRILETFFSFKYASLMAKKNQSTKTAGLINFIDDIIDYESLHDIQIGSINKSNIKEKLSNINHITDAYSHGSNQNLDNNSFIPDETLLVISEEVLDIIKFFDSIHHSYTKLLTEEQLTVEPKKNTILAFG